MKIEVYECEHCKGLQRTKEEYQKCKRSCAKKSRDKIKYEQAKARAIEKADYIRLNAESVWDIPKMLVGFFKNDLDRELTISKFDMRFNPEMANTHDCPLNGVTNWGRKDPNAPRHYPGWYGEFRGTTNIGKKPIKLFDGHEIDSIFDVIGKYNGAIRGLHCGGGSGGPDFGFSLRMYVDDFPKIKEKYDRYVILREMATIRAANYKKLFAEAETKIIGEDKQLNTLAKHKAIIEVLSKNNMTLHANRRQEIMNSAEYKNFVKLPHDPNFNDAEYDKLAAEFSK